MVMLVLAGSDNPVPVLLLRLIPEAAPAPAVMLALACAVNPVPVLLLRLIPEAAPAPVVMLVLAGAVNPVPVLLLRLIPEAAPTPVRVGGGAVVDCAVMGGRMVGGAGSCLEAEAAGRA